MKNDPEKGFCPSCGKEVEIFSLLSKGDFQKKCIVCEMDIDEKNDTEDNSETSNLKKSASLDKTTPSFYKKLDKVIIAEDSKLLTELMIDLFKEKGYSKALITCSNGFSYIKELTRSLINKEKPNLIILDIFMPEMNGLNCCVATRAIEQEFQIEKPTPILFFTSSELDSAMKKTMEKYPPATHISKGDEADMQSMINRLEIVISKLLKTK